MLRDDLGRHVVLRPCMSPCRSDYIIVARDSRDARRVVSEDSTS
jgi:hypothetical protein